MYVLHKYVGQNIVYLLNWYYIGYFLTPLTSVQTWLNKMCIPENNLYICDVTGDFIWLFSYSRQSKTFSRQHVLTIYRDKNLLMTNSKVQTFSKSNESLEIIRKGIVDFLSFELRWNVFRGICLNKWLGGVEEFLTGFCGFCYTWGQTGPS